jgi:two-component system sensor kinase FixL
MSHPEQKTSNTTFPQEQGLAEALINTTQDAVITIDRQGRIAIFNSAAERIFGYTRAEIVGREVEILMPELYAKEHQDYITRYEQTGERRAIGRIRTVAAQRKNGQVFPSNSQ